MRRLSELYLRHVRSFPCILCGADKVDAHHVLHRQWKEANRDDYMTIPLCRGCHSLWHNMGMEESLKAFKLKPTNFYRTVVELLVSFFTNTYTPPDFEPPETI